MDRLNTYHNNNRAKEEVCNIIDQFSLLEIWRTRNPDKREYSCKKSGSFPNKASRIDFALVSKGLDQYIDMTLYTSCPFTDHRALYMLLDLKGHERGVGYWKCNSSLLKDSEFVNIMNQELCSTIASSSGKKPGDRWELIKKRVKICSMKYARQKSSNDKIVVAQLIEKVDRYESRLPLNEQENTLLEQTKQDLEEKTMERIRGVMFRSKAKWYEEGERNTKYFFSLEKARYNAKTCYKIIDEQGEYIY